jgi:hypothetical protein
VSAAKALPTRVQRKRTKGWRKPDGAIYVGRPTVWANPFGTDAKALITVASKAQAVRDYRAMIEDEIRTMGYLPYYLRELRGKRLMCWCGRGPCHADVLIEIVNLYPLERPPSRAELLTIARLIDRSRPGRQMRATRP